MRKTACTVALAAALSGAGCSSSSGNDLLSALAACVNSTDRYTFDLVVGPLLDVLEAVGDPGSFPNVTLVATADPLVWDFTFVPAVAGPGVDTLTGTLTLPPTPGDGPVSATWVLAAFSGTVQGSNDLGFPFTIDLVGGNIVSYFGAGSFTSAPDGCASFFSILEAEKLVGDLVSPPTAGILDYAAMLPPSMLELSIDFGADTETVLLDGVEIPFADVFGP